jgi:hypothetical protein
MGVQRQIGPISSGDTHLIRTSSKAAKVYALTLPGVTDATAVLGPDGSSRHTFVLEDNTTVSIYHGGSPLSVSGLNQRITAPLGGQSIAWVVDPRHTGPVAIATVSDGGVFWQVVVKVSGSHSVREALAPLASFHESRRRWPDLVVTPPVSHVDHLLLRGRPHCVPGRGAGHGHR